MTEFTEERSWLSLETIAVVEDDSSASQQIQNYLSLYQKENEQEFSVTVFADGLSILEDYHPIWDIILMDIEMPLMDGMTAAKCIRELDQSVIIIFITNMAKYAIKGYEVGALDFVLKPVSYFAFSLKITKALTSLAHREKSLCVADLQKRHDAPSCRGYHLHRNPAPPDDCAYRNRGLPSGRHTDRNGGQLGMPALPAATRDTL